MLPKDVLERFLDGPFQYEELRIVCLHMWEKLAGQDANSGAQPMDIGQIDKSEGEDEDVNAVQQRRPHDLSNHKQESHNERKTLQPSDCQLVTISVTPIDSTRQESRGGKGHPVRLCPSENDCQDVNEVGTEPSGDADSDLLDWGDDPIATTQ